MAFKKEIDFKLNVAILESVTPSQICRRCRLKNLKKLELFFCCRCHHYLYRMMECSEV